MSAATTFAPALRKPRTCSRPMPRAAPVIRTTLPSTDIDALLGFHPAGQHSRTFRPARHASGTSNLKLQTLNRELLTVNSEPFPPIISLLVNGIGSREGSLS